MKKKYKSYSAEFKLKVASEAILGEKTLNEIALEYDVYPTQVMEWKKHLLLHGINIFHMKKSMKAVQEIQENHEKKERKQEVPENKDHIYQELGKMITKLVLLEGKK